VATVVCKLFHIVQPDLAVRLPPSAPTRSHPPQVFGRKDYQQFQLLCRMVRDLDLDVQMVGAPLLRDPDGLALSSRNVRLAPAARAAALAISAALREAGESYRAGQRDGSALGAAVRGRIEAAGGEVDYVAVVAQESLQPLAQLTAPAVVAVAARFGGVRLLDNVEIE